jgi:hypothetical protein
VAAPQQPPRGQTPRKEDKGGKRQQQQQPLQDDLAEAERPAREAHRVLYELPDPMRAAEWDVDNMCFFCGGGHRATVCPNFLDRASGGLHEVAKSRRRVNEFLRTFKPLKTQVHERRLVQQHGQGQAQQQGQGHQGQVQAQPQLRLSLRLRGSSRSKAEEEAAAVADTEVVATVTAEAEAERESSSKEEMVRVAVVEHVDGETRTLC